LVYALWENKLSTKKSIGTSPFQLVYGTDVVFPTSLGMPVMKYIQEENNELNPTQRRINQQIELHQIREGLCDKAQTYQEKMKQVFGKRVNTNDFNIGDLVLKWDFKYKDKGKHGKFDNLWKGPYKVFAFLENDSFLTYLEYVTVE
jgi:FtsZ-binding cell division protein ZapB